MGNTEMASVDGIDSIELEIQSDHQKSSELKTNPTKSTSEDDGKWIIAAFFFIFFFFLYFFSLLMNFRFIVYVRSCANWTLCSLTTCVQQFCFHPIFCYRFFLSLHYNFLFVANFFLFFISIICCSHESRASYCLFL